MSNYYQSFYFKWVKCYKASGWGVVKGTKVLREYKITAGKIQTGGGRAKPLIADYVVTVQPIH